MGQKPTSPLKTPALALHEAQSVVGGGEDGGGDGGGGEDGGPLLAPGFLQMTHPDPDPGPDF
jgi:hypothetical protein